MFKKLMTATATLTAAAVVSLVPTSAQAIDTPTADRYQGTTRCGAYTDGGTGYTYQMEKSIPISSAAWTRLLANDPYGLKVADTIWGKVAPSLGTVFPLYNFSSQSYTLDNYGNFIFAQSNLNKAMNAATCGSTFWISGPKNLAGAAVLTAGGPHAGRMQVTQVRTNGISFKGIDGVMKGAVMNFRIQSGASRTFLNVHVTGPNIDFLNSLLRDAMKTQADATWQQFATNIGAAL